MRRMRLVFAALAAMVIGASSAQAIEVRKQIEVPGKPEAVWAVASAFCSIKTWHPLVENCEETKEGAATFRILTLKGGATVKEQLLGSDATSYSYEIISGPLPVKNYKAKLGVEPEANADGQTVVYWQTTFDAAGASDAEAEAQIVKIFELGLEGIEKLAAGPKE